jgi:hypothetical protein
MNHPVTLWQDVLTQHFGYLVDAREYADRMQQVLEQIMEIVTGVELESDALMIRFTNEIDKRHIYWNVPRSIPRLTNLIPKVSTVACKSTVISVVTTLYSTLPSATPTTWAR